MSKIIDFKKKGNVVRLYCGNDDLKEWTGDDWDHHPYEHTASIVYSEYIAEIYDIYVDFDFDVLEPSEDWNHHGNSPWCKDDMIARKVPCIVIARESEYGWNTGFNACAMGEKSVRIYFGDDPKKISEEYSQIVHVKNSR